MYGCWRYSFNEKMMLQNIIFDYIILSILNHPTLDPNRMMKIFSQAVFEHAQNSVNTLKQVIQLLRT